MPIEHWLRDWADDFLGEKRLREEGFFNSEPIRKMWLEHVTARRRWHCPLWDVLMFQAWLENGGGMSGETLSIPLDSRLTAI